MVWLPVFGIFNVRTDVDYAIGDWMYELRRKMHWKLTQGEKSLA